MASFGRTWRVRGTRSTSTAEIIELINAAERGFQLTYRTTKDTSLSLFLHGEPAYSHLLLLPSKSKGLGPALTPNFLVDFVNQGSNILLALSSEQGVSSAVSSLLLELDVSLSPDRNSVVVDHFNHDGKSAGDKHDVLVLPSPELSGNKAVKNYFSVDGLLAFPHAVGQVLGNTSPLLHPILKASETAYIYNPQEESDAPEEPFATGSQISLVTAFQARNSARITVLGSAEALEDKWFTASVQPSTPKSSSTSTANRAFARGLSAWTFHERGVLRAGAIRHQLSDPVEAGSTAEKMSAAGASYRDEEGNPSIYRIKNNVHYTIALSEWNGESWEPFTPPPNDAVQLEISMLSPFHRLNLAQNTSASSTDEAVYTSSFKLPDQHGIFNFLVEYRRPFLTNLEEKRTVTVRHFAHDEWPRSFAISAAWPWIGGIWVTVIGWVAFVAVWLYSKPTEVKGGKVAGAKR